MKKRLLSFCFVIVIFISMFTLCANAQKIEKHNLEFDLPEEFIVLSEDNISSNNSAIKSLGFTQETFKNYINANNIVLFASLPDKSCQISVNVNKTEFTEKTENMEYLEDEYIARLLPSLITTKVHSNEIKVINGSKFVRVENLGSDKAGEFSTLQYVTVKNQKLYTITFSFSDTNLSSENIQYAESIMGNLTISALKQKMTIKNIQDIIVYIILILVIVFLVFIILYFVYTIVIDVLNKRNTSDVAPYVKIKRRRFK